MPGGLARAVKWLRERLHEPVRIEELAAMAGVRPRTLEAHFREYLGTTPLGWVRQMRLYLARRKLLDGEAGTTVTDVALASGFSQLGRFAEQYRAQFGEKPSETLRRARRPGAALGDAAKDEALRLTWRAMPAAYAVAPAECGAALEALEQAQDLAPGCAPPLALAAWCRAQRVAQRFGSAPERDRERARALAARAQALAPDDAMVLTHCSGALSLMHRLEEADALIEQAIALDPWLPFAWLRRGWVSAYRGDSEGALRAFGRLMGNAQLRHTAFIGIACAHFAAGRFDRAALWARDGVQAHPASFWAERIVVAAGVHGGATAEAARVARELLRKDPGLTVSEARVAWPFPPGFMDRLADGLARAGVPRA